jgi:hypothetical protein
MIARHLSKSTLLLIVSVLLGLPSFADCAGGGIEVFPKGSSVSPNSIFILEGYANSQQIIHGLGTQYQAYLVSGDTKIRLVVTEVCEGGFDLTQALLKPEALLQPGLKYTLQVDSIPTLTRYNPESRKHEAITYHVLAALDTVSPLVSSRPKEIGKSIEHFGCGPAVYVDFSNPASDKSELLVKTTVLNLTTKQETTYYLQPKDGEISIGHGMCSGEFYLESGTQFEVEFTFVDASGNAAPWSGNRIRFTPPVDKLLLED